MLRDSPIGEPAQQQLTRRCRGWIPWRASRCAGRSPAPASWRHRSSGWAWPAASSTWTWCKEQRYGRIFVSVCDQCDGNGTKEENARLSLIRVCAKNWCLPACVCMQQMKMTDMTSAARTRQEWGVKHCTTGLL
eukprot:scaffold64485_cov15-Tisochrysis_lutea.AAC.1